MWWQTDFENEVCVCNTHRAFTMLALIDLKLSLCLLPSLSLLTSLSSKASIKPMVPIIVLWPERIQLTQSTWFFYVVGHQE